ncbi:hypothetical protein C8R44DRAFT_577878, partial [Mycena epipterygia]
PLLILSSRQPSTPNQHLLCPSTASSKRQSPRTVTQKIDIILETIQDQNWTLTSFLLNLFRWKDHKGKETHRSLTHSQMVSIFLAGRTRETVGNIISEWMAHPDG